MKILAVINRKAGTSSFKDHDYLFSLFSKNGHNLSLKNTEYAGHAIQLAKEAVECNFDAVIALGGDGTINEVAQSLVNTNTILGILPSGSGNGLARHLGIPMNIKKASELILARKTIDIDTGRCNKHPFFVTAGVGLEARIAELFNSSSQRGLKTYVKCSWQALKSIYSFYSDLFEKEVINMTIANCNQWGNNAFITPNASLVDGKFNLCTITKLSFFSALNFIFKSFRKVPHKHVSFEETLVTDLKTEFKTKLPLQVDGEFIGYHSHLNVHILPNSLKVFV